MTRSNEKHARRVSVTRMNKSSDSHARKAVAVRLRDEKNKPADPTQAEKHLPAESAEPIEVPVAPARIPAAVKPMEEQPAPEVTPTEPEPTEEPLEPEATPAEAEPTEEPLEPEDIPAEAEPTEEPLEPEDIPAEPEPTEGPLEPENTPAESESTEELLEPEDISAGEQAIPSMDEVASSQVEDEVYTNLVYEQTEIRTNDTQKSEEKPPRKLFALPEGFTLPQWLIPQKWGEITILRKLIMAVSVALALFSLLPLLVGVLSPGILPPLMIAAFFFLCALYWPLIDGCESTWGNVMIAVVAVCVMAGVVYLSFVSGKMISASTNILREDRADVTVVVLGCKVNGDKPSRMLQARLEIAAEFLLDHPQAHCIVSGGKGPDEQYHEAFIMKNYLVDRGISPMRIIMENASTSTLENINFSAVLAEKYNCHERFLIVTDRFHQYRAMSAANDLGIVSYALNVETVWYLAMPYWFREMAAITRDWLVA